MASGVGDLMPRVEDIYSELRRGRGGGKQNNINKVDIGTYKTKEKDPKRTLGNFRVVQRDRFTEMHIRGYIQ